MMNPLRQSLCILLLLTTIRIIAAQEPFDLYSTDNHERGKITAHRFLTEGPIDIIIKYSSEEGKLRAKKRTEERYRSSGVQMSKYKKELPDLNVEVLEVDDFDEYVVLGADEDVLYVEEDPKRYFFSAHSVSRNLAEEIPYGINLVRALDVDDQFVGNRKVCIVDTGYDITHEDLPKASTGSSITGTDGVNGVPWNEDDHGHGSHCAGTIAAVGSNNKGVVGVNRNGKLNLHIGRVFGVTGSWISGTSLITVVQQCRDAGSNVVSMSLGGGGYSQTEFDAYESLYKNDNVLLVAAAGNDGNSAYSYPASYEPVMSVAAIDSNKNKAGFSQYNDQVDIAAPGVSVKSTLPGNAYAAWSGTSMATPHVSGVAALIWSHYPDKPATEIRQTLEGTAEDLGAAGRDNEFGHGMVRADLAIIALSNGQYTNAPTISPAPSPKPTMCEDYPPGWYDSDGPYYDCAWYAIGSNCDTYGSGYRNDGYVANEACCACGGGLRGPPDTPSPTVSEKPSSFPSASPSVKPSARPSKSPSSEPTTSPSEVPSEVPSVRPSARPSFVPSPSPSSMPSMRPTSAPSSLPSLVPSSPPSSAPSNSIVAVVQTFAKSSLVVKCPFNSTDVEESMSSDLIAALKQEEVTVDVTVTILSDVSCTSVERRLENLNVEALIESTVTIRDETKNFTSNDLLDAVTNTTNDKFAVSSVLVIEAPSAAPSATPSSLPTWHPSSSPSARPSTSPSMAPSISPSSLPSISPSSLPSTSPSDIPSELPSMKPSSNPSESPTNVPTLYPSASPTDVPSPSPSFVPTVKPSESPTDCPSFYPSVVPTDLPSSFPSIAPTGLPSLSSLPTELPSAFPSKVPSESPSIKPTTLPSVFPTAVPTMNPTPQSYLTCRTRRRNKRRRLCIRTSGCRWIRGVHWRKRCQPVTPAPTPMPSRTPTSLPSSPPTTAVLHSFAKADVIVTCPFNSTAVEDSMKSSLISELRADGLSVKVSVTILSDVSCADAAERRLESLNVEALIESTVVITHGDTSSYSPSMLVAAVANVKGDAYTVFNSELIDSPSSTPSASPSLLPSLKPSAHPTKVPTATRAPSLSPTANPTPQSYLTCRTRRRNKRRRLCIRTSGCRWIRGVHWRKRCQPIISNN